MMTQTSKQTLAICEDSCRLDLHACSEPNTLYILFSTLHSRCCWCPQEPKSQRERTETFFFFRVQRSRHVAGVHVSRWGVHFNTTEASGRRREGHAAAVTNSLGWRARHSSRRVREDTSFCAASSTEHQHPYRIPYVGY